MSLGRIAAAALAVTLIAGAARAGEDSWSVLHADSEVTVSAHRPVGAAPPAGQLWVRAEYARRQKLHGFAFLSETYLAQVYCDTGTIIRTEWQLFSRPGLTGKVHAYAPRDLMAWTIQPDTVDDWVAKAACAKSGKG
jgi:hypothetical protein